MQTCQEHADDVIHKDSWLPRLYRGVVLTHEELELYLQRTNVLLCVI